ncbi:penicillin-binding protein 2 [Schaalia sp. ZJ405]|uniref:peptidoglycan D,D-transpeptidase FtsI family protein n=1 Tax=unclassified Schaalia TaxID=2691889 RepID=UPI0013ECBC1F|nr:MULTISPECIES: penicillin-binding protein 2 [unclassified Schaalia]QPK81434.1 penicillin-binding protein 2 [Schaalia sp. ZJ405]
MNHQIRRLFLVILLMFALLGFGVTNSQFIQAPSLNADPRNERTILHSAEVDRGPIIVDGNAIASSSKIDGSRRFQRTYAQGPLYAGITGYFSAAVSQSTGLEASAESILDGNSQALLGQRLKNLFTGEKRQGGGVVLTIRPKMQQIAAEQLGNRKGAVVALDAKTGAVLAMYSSPSYDPNALAIFDSSKVSDTYSSLANDPNKPLINRTIGGDRYAPGSTFKILTTIGLLEKQLATPDTTMPSPVSTTLPGTVTNVANSNNLACGDGNPTLTEAFARSCNTTFIIASEKMTTADFTDITSRFGFNEKDTIPLPVTPSVFPDDADAAQLAMASIGQYTVQVTPLKMAQVAQAIANNGTMMKPYLIDQIVDADLQPQSTTTPKVAGHPISPEIASQLNTMMQAVVNRPYGTGTQIGIPGVSVAAKTGTAETGTQGFTNGWAVGFAPANDPQIAFAVIVEGDASNPVTYGAVAASPIARALVEAGLQ